MPIYEYKCEACGKVFEHFQSPSESPLKDCPKCKGKIHKLISSCSFQLKGTGWYVTDYPKKSDAPLAKRDKTGEAVVKADSGKKESAGGKETPAKAAAENQAAGES